MNDNNLASVIKTVLRVDQRLETVRYSLHEVLEDDTASAEGHSYNVTPNSFVLGWVKSFTIIMISVTLIKESEHTTKISIETSNTDHDNKTKRIVHDGFYDFLSFLKRTLVPVKTNADNFVDETEYKGVWRWLFVILFTIFMAWYFFEK